MYKMNTSVNIRTVKNSQEFDYHSEKSKRDLENINGIGKKLIENAAPNREEMHLSFEDVNTNYNSKR